MRKKFLFIGLGFLMLFSFHNISSAFNDTSDRYITISGLSQFDSTLIAKFMEKHGYVHMGESLYKRQTKTNVFAARDAEVIIKNKYSMVMGTGITDEKGNFSITVPRDNIYKVIVRFHGMEFEKPVEPPVTEGLTLNLGFFSSETIDSWFEKVPLSYCYTCDIRYLETQEYRSFCLRYGLC